LWLAQPGQLGIPPTRLEVVDSRAQPWPGFAEPVDCFLFRFTYQFADAQYSNIGIAGPLTHALAADLLEMSPEDIYATFAGGHAQHEGIYETDVVDLTDEQRIEVSRLERRLRDAGYDAIQPLQLGFLLGQRMLVATAVLDGVAGIAVVDSQDIQWLASAGRQRPFGPSEACSLYKGRRLLRAFDD